MVEAGLDFAEMTKEVVNAWCPQDENKVCTESAFRRNIEIFEDDKEFLKLLKKEQKQHYTNVRLRTKAPALIQNEFERYYRERENLDAHLANAAPQDDVRIARLRKLLATVVKKHRRNLAKLTAMHRYV